MKCPECVAADQRSHVYVGYSSTTLLDFAPYYDEDGNWHYHDPNTCTTSYSCSNGHKWSVNTPNTPAEPACCAELATTPK